MKQERLFSFNFTYILQILQAQRPGFILYQQPNYIDRLKRFFEEMQNDFFVFQCLQKLYEHDESTFLHSIDVAFLSFAFSDVFYTENPQSFHEGCLLHDIGKYFIPAHILKKKGQLTHNERLVMQHHTIYGHAYLQKEKGDYISELALHHHEHPSGIGYPCSLIGEEMKFDYFILRVMDEFSALTLDRVYRVGLDLKKAQEIIISNIQEDIDSHHLSIFAKQLSIIFTESEEEITQLNDLLHSTEREKFSFDVKWLKETEHSEKVIQEMKHKSLVNQKK